MKKNKVYHLVLLITFLIFSFLTILSGITVQGHVTQGNIPSNVSIMKSLAISFSSSLANGIYFGKVNFLPANNVSAVENYNGSFNSTNYYVLVSSDGNVPVDLCLKANSGMISSNGDIIGVKNESYSTKVGSSNLTVPSLTNETSFTLNYTKSGGTIPTGNYSFLRFWLDIPAAQAAGEYNNSIFFKGVEAGYSC